MPTTQHVSILIKPGQILDAYRGKSVAVVGAVLVGIRIMQRLAPYRHSIYSISVIQSFKCSDTAVLHQRCRVARWTNIEAAARRKLDQLDAAGELRDMAQPPGNRLKAMCRGRKGQHSIRVNDQFRVCFVWTPQGTKDVEIVEYH